MPEHVTRRARGTHPLHTTLHIHREMLSLRYDFTTLRAAVPLLPSLSQPLHNMINIRVDEHAALTRHRRGPCCLLLHLSTARVAAPLVRPLNFISVSTKQREARFATLRESMIAKWASLFLSTEKTAQRLAVLWGWFCHLPLPSVTAAHLVPIENVKKRVRKVSLVELLCVPLIRALSLAPAHLCARCHFPDDAFDAWNAGMNTMVERRLLCAGGAWRRTGEPATAPSIWSPLRIMHSHRARLPT